MKASSSYAAIAALTAVASARNLDLPPATASVVLPLDGFTPKPTDGPKAVHELFRRADASTTTVLVAPDNTCGYISGRPGAAYTCMGTSATCIFFTAEASQPGAVACCNEIECNARIACIDYNGYWSKSQCNDGCEVDAFTLKCTDTKMPYCNTISFDGNVRDYFCYNLEITTLQGAQTTYKGGDYREFSPLALSDTTNSGSLRLESTPVAGGAGGTITSGGVTTATVTSGGGGSGDGDEKKKSSTPVGPIVGGVVGGVGALGLAGIALFFFLRNKKNKKAAAAANTTAAPPGYQPPMQQQQQQQQQPGTGFQQMPPNQQGGVYYDPKVNPYPSPNNQYVQPNQGGFVPMQQHDMNSPTNTMPVSPTGTQITDPRLGAQTTSPVPSFNSYNTVPVNQQQPVFQPQEAVIHEAPANTAEERRKEVHEMA